MRIGLDLDNVLSDELTALIAWHNETYGTSLQPDDFHVHQFHDVWGGTYDEAIEKMKRFSVSSHCADMPVVPGAKEAVRALQKKHELHVITARPTPLLELTLTWIERHFPGTFASVTLCNHYSDTGIPRKKSDVCTELGLDWFADDDIVYAEDCVAENRRVLLFRLPWSQHENLAKGIVAVKTWEEALRVLESHDT